MVEVFAGGNQFTEYTKQAIIEILSYVFMNLKKNQEQYITDLRKALKE